MPLIFDELLGQDELRRALSGDLLRGTLGHALLITGPAGSGKKSWAMALARAILCEKRSEGNCCLSCDSCHLFDSGNHPEFFLIRPDGRNIKIEQIRAVRGSFYLLGGNKVCLIEQAETMTAEASSSLLKILEDPPAGLFFVLMAEQVQQLFDTIVSRCRRYKLLPLDTAQVRDLLMQKMDIDEDRAAFLARFSGGLPGRALKLAVDGDFEKRFSEAKTMAYNLASGRDSAHQLLLWASSLADREDLFSFLELLCLFYRDSLVRSICTGERLLMAPGRQLYELKADAAAGLEEVVLVINEALHEMVATNVNRRLLLEKMLILIQRGLNKCPR